MTNNQWLKTLVLLAAVLGSFPAWAQKLNEASSPASAKDYLRAFENKNRQDMIGNSSEANAPVSAQTPQNAAKATVNPAVSSVKQAPQTQQSQKPIEAKLVDGKIQLENMPNIKTTDGSKRGNASFMRVPETNEKPKDDEDVSLIFLYYDNFKITRSLSGGVGCDVKFAVMTTLDQRLINLSVKLKWPGMTTSLSFENVNPNIETYYTYALFGEGCYTMDKIPNIIVNRCRAKGMSQENCATKIRWLSRK